MPIFQPFAASIYKHRRKELVRLVRDNYQRDGVVLLFGSFEPEGQLFEQDASFMYYTGIEEPASVLSIDCQSGTDVLHVPQVDKQRVKWVSSVISPATQAVEHQLYAIEYLGNVCPGYQCHQFFAEQEYAALIAKIKQWVAEKKVIYTTYPETAHGYIQQRLIIMRLLELISGLRESLVDISSIIASMRRQKGKEEIEQIFHAIAITTQAQYAAAETMDVDKIEYEVEAALGYVFTASGATKAFPSIVAAGKNSTVLHYQNNDKKIENGALVVVDIGARFNYYCADITRTYPVNGKFSKRQKEVYNLVLECQEYIAGLAKPGMWLSNPEKPEQSLNHLAKEFFNNKGYGNYFPHGIGHFLGLDVHDVGDYLQPLQVGDVITIEPGLYIPEENIGVRIEDNYWIIQDGAICLSENLIKNFDEIEQLVLEKKIQQQSTDVVDGH